MILARARSTAEWYVHAIREKNRVAKSECMSLIGSRNACPRNPSVVVSVTTYPARAKASVLTLKSLVTQSLQPDALLLVVAESQFHDVMEVLGPVPAKLGITVVTDSGDKRSYKKVWPAVEMFPDSVIVTADDDVLYPYTWLESLLDDFNSWGRTSIVGHRGVEIRRESDSTPTAYRTWRPATHGTTSSDLLLTGMGGIAYPPGVLRLIAGDYEQAVQICPDADDIWLRAGAFRYDVAVRKTFTHGSGDFPPSDVFGRRDGLHLGNVTVDSGNDVAINSVRRVYGSHMF